MDGTLQFAPGWHIDGCLPHSLRGRVEAVVDSLIALLDAIDGDTDAEGGTDDDMCSAEDRAGIEYPCYPGDPEDAEPETDSEPTPYD